MGSQAYESGYSFERLRELEMVELDTPEARNGFYIDGCLKRLFEMVWQGTGTEVEQGSFLTALPERLGVGVDDDGDPGAPSVHHTFRMVPLRSHLFDPSRTPFLNSVRLRDHVL